MWEWKWVASHWVVDRHVFEAFVGVLDFWIINGVKEGSQYWHGKVFLLCEWD